jgi:hypothetical protein
MYLLYVAGSAKEASVPTYLEMFKISGMPSFMITTPAGE